MFNYVIDLKTKVKTVYDVEELLKLTQKEYNKLDGNIKYFASKEPRILQKFYRIVTLKGSPTYSYHEEK